MKSIPTSVPIGLPLHPQSCNKQHGQAHASQHNPLPTNVTLTPEGQGFLKWVGIDHKPWNSAEEDFSWKLKSRLELYHGFRSSTTINYQSNWRVKSSNSNHPFHFEWLGFIALFQNYQAFGKKKTQSSRMD